MGGQIDYAGLAILDAGSQVQAGAVKAYALGASQRNAAVPDVPTAIEAGLPAFQASPWFALFAPRSTPRPILDKLTDALDQALDDHAVVKRFVDLGGDVPSKARRGQKQLTELLQREIARWRPIIKAANVNL